VEILSDKILRQALELLEKFRELKIFAESDHAFRRELRRRIEG